MSESSEPAVMFNAKNFLIATESMTVEQVGYLIDNLCADMDKRDIDAVLRYPFVDSYHPQKQGGQ